MSLDERRIAARALRDRALLIETDPDDARLPTLGREVAQLGAQLASNGSAPNESGDLLVDMDAAMEAAEQPIEKVIDPFAVRGFLTVVAGQHSSGKSWLLTATGHAAHRGGGEVAGMRCSSTSVLYVDAENGPRLTALRFKAAGIPADGLLVADGTQLRLPRDLDRLRALIEETDVGLVMLDSLRRLAPDVRENESDDMATLIGSLAMLARELDVGIVLVHHASTKRGAATVRGSSSIEDQADMVFTLGRVGEDRDRERRRMKATKYRIDIEPPPLWLRMGTVAGRFTVSNAEAYQGVDDGPSAEEQLAERIDALADQVCTDGGWAPGRLAVAVGSDQQSGTFKRALKLLEDRGAWRSGGSTRDRRWQPSDDSGHSGHPHRNGPSGPNGGTE